MVAVAVISIKHHVCTPTCTAGWPAGRKCHCGRCGENFSTPANFDKHQDHGTQLRCKPPGAVGLALNKRGLWAAPGEVAWLMPGSNDDDEGVSCPVCLDHSVTDSLASQQVMLRGVQAILDHDDDMVKDVYSTLTPYDGHTAITFVYLLMHDVAMLTGHSVEQMVETYRERLFEAQTESP